MVVCVNISTSVFGEQWTTEVISPRSPATLNRYSLPVTVMVANQRLLRALQFQRIANTSRKFNSTASATPAVTPAAPTILKSLPEHRPLLPVLLSHNIPSKIAKACADRYDRYADQLRSDTEIKLAPYLLDQNDGQHARIYTVFLNNYSRALQDWAQSILNAILQSLKRDSAELQNWNGTYPPPLWLPVCVPSDVTRTSIDVFQSPQDQRSYLHAETQVRVVWLPLGLN